MTNSERSYGEMDNIKEEDADVWDIKKDDNGQWTTNAEIDIPILDGDDPLEYVIAVLTRALALVPEEYRNTARLRIYGGEGDGSIHAVQYTRLSTEAEIAKIAVYDRDEQCRKETYERAQLLKLTKKYGPPVQDAGC